MALINFEAEVIEINSWAIVKLPSEESAKLPSRGQVMSRTTVNDRTFQVVLEPDGRGGHWFRVTDDMPVRVNDTAVVKIEPTKNWPEPELPEDFVKALEAEPKIYEFFQAITPMAKWEWPRWICDTKNPATRAKRINVSIDKLRKGMRRPCCFNRAACTQPEVAKNAQLLETAPAN